MSQCDVLVEADGSCVRAYLGALVEPRRHHGQVVVFERVEMPLRKLCLLCNFLQGQAPPFASALNDNDLAEILTFARRVFGKGGSPITAEQVKAQRK